MSCHVLRQAPPSQHLHSVEYVEVYPETPLCRNKFPATTKPELSAFGRAVGPGDDPGVAEEKTDITQKAEQIANYWRGSGLDVTVQEQDQTTTAQEAPGSTMTGSNGFNGRVVPQGVSVALMRLFIPRPLTADNSPLHSYRLLWANYRAYVHPRGMFFGGKRGFSPERAMFRKCRVFSTQTAFFGMRRKRPFCIMKPLL